MELTPAADGARLRARRRAVHRRIRCGYRCAQQGIQGIDAVLRRLHANVVADAVRPVHPEVRRHRAAAAERDQHAVGDIALRQAHLRRLLPIHVQADYRLVRHLVNVGVRHPRNV